MSRIGENAAVASARDDSKSNDAPISFAVGPDAEVTVSTTAPQGSTPTAPQGSTPSAATPSDARASTPAQNDNAATPARGATKLGYLPGLDGLRAISVLAVLAFHFRPDHSLFTGGFLGVEIFFVISGYLITALLLEERRKTHRTALRKFWLRRIRRLFAALYSALLAIGLFVAVFYNEELGRLRDGLISGAVYFSNWQQISGGVRYGDSDLRAPLGHLWSLAVEEQFYLVWPLLFVAGGILLKQRFKWAIGAGALLSWIWMAYLIANRPSFRGNLLRVQIDQVNDAFNRIYLATDTRAAGLLLGAFLAFFWVPRRLQGSTGKNAAQLLDGAAVLAAIILAILMFTAELHSVWLYWWGFALVDICTVVLIAATVHPVSHVGRLLGVKPLQYIGVRSYGIYLWGVAIFEFTRPNGADLNHSGTTTFLIRLLLVAAITELSYRCIEQPVRNGALARLWRQLQSAQPPHRDRLVLRWQVVGATLLLTTVSLSIAAYAAKVPKDAAAPLCSGDDIITNPKCKNQPTYFTLPVTTVDPTHPTKPGSSVVTNPPALNNSGIEVSGIGDSVMQGAITTLTKRLSGFGPTEINADKSRHEDVCLEIMRSLRDANRLGRVVLMACANNGNVSAKFVDKTMAVAGPLRKVVFITAKVPRSWEAPNNQIIRDSMKRFKNARMFDWNFFAVTLPESYFAPGDHYHLNGPGVPYYADRIYEFIKGQNWF